MSIKRRNAWVACSQPRSECSKLPVFSSLGRTPVSHVRDVNYQLNIETRLTGVLPRLLKTGNVDCLLRTSQGTADDGVCGIR